MFYDIKQFSFLETIRDNFEIVLNEFKKNYKVTPLMDHFAFHPQELPLHNKTKEIENWVYENGFHPEQTGYDARNGEWTAFPLFKKDEPINWYDVKKSFPETFQLVKDIPNLNLAAFFRLAPGSGTKNHHHTQRNLIFHLCMTDLDGESIMNCNGDSRKLNKKGDWCLFDYSKEHSSFNFSDKERINLAIDFTPNETILKS